MLTNWPVSSQPVLLIAVMIQSALTERRYICDMARNVNNDAHLMTALWRTMCNALYDNGYSLKPLLHLTSLAISFLGSLYYGCSSVPVLVWIVITVHKALTTYSHTYHVGECDGVYTVTVYRMYNELIGVNYQPFCVFIWVWGVCMGWLCVCVEVDGYVKTPSERKPNCISS